MKNLFAFLFLISAFVTSAQIPNSSFELWDNQPRLQLWATNSYPLTLPPYNPYVVVKDTDHYSGSFSANLIGNGVFHSYAKTTFAIAQHPASLSLHYKINFPPCVNDQGNFEKDTVSILVEILNNTAVVDSGYWSYNGNNNLTWSQLIIPVSKNSSVFDSCRITIAGGKVYGGCGFAAAATEFKVDALELNNATCSTIGVVRDGVESGCLLIDTGTGSWLLPCNVGLGFLGFSAGDTIRFSYIANPGCITTCQQGATVDLTCVDTSNIQPLCNLSVSLQKQNPTSYVANNGWLKATVTGGTSPFTFSWNPNIGSTDSIANLGNGIYCVTVGDANNCTATSCDSLAGAHVCIDSALLCSPQGLCCDAPLFDPVCGCDSITYTNGCIATYFGGVTSFYPGICITTGIQNISIATGISISPVPAKESLNLKYELRRSGNAEIRITNALGQMIKIFTLGFETSGIYQKQIPLVNFTAGVYWIEVKTEMERKIKVFVVE